MSRVWFNKELETVATFCRILRRDGVALGFTTHDRDLWFDDVLHRSSPGMAPSAVRRSADLEPDSIDVDGVLADDSIAEDDLAAGRFDGARVLFGLVDWQSCERHVLYAGRIGEVACESGQFTVQLLSRKADLDVDAIPRTSPSCRAHFCGPECGLSAARYTHEGYALANDPATGAVTVSTVAALSTLIGGTLRWLDGACAGMSATIVDAGESALFLDALPDLPLAAGTRFAVREGCDRRLATCAERFGNALNFRGEPFLPGNDLVARYAPIAS